MAVRRLANLLPSHLIPMNTTIDRMIVDAQGALAVAKLALPPFRGSLQLFFHHHSFLAIRQTESREGQLAPSVRQRHLDLSCLIHHTILCTYSRQGKRFDSKIARSLCCAQTCDYSVLGGGCTGWRWQPECANTNNSMG